jgi:hypothetical protein
VSNTNRLVLSRPVRVIVRVVVFVISNECSGLKRRNENGMRICSRKSKDVTKSKKVCS